MQYSLCAIGTFYHVFAAPVTAFEHQSLCVHAAGAVTSCLHLYSLYVCMCIFSLMQAHAVKHVGCILNIDQAVANAPSIVRDILFPQRYQWCH